MRLLIQIAVSGSILLASGHASSNSFNNVAYCPGSITDTDGDGWGFENNRPCRVITPGRDVPVCSLVYGDTDSDGDGWGWLDWADGTCLVDNTTVDRNFTITNADGVDTVGQIGYPLIDEYVSPFGSFAWEMQIASDGTLYHHRIPDNNLAATDSNGATLWKQHSIGGRILNIELDSAEQNLYVASADNTISSYSTTDGQRQWTSEPLGNITDLQIGNTAIIVVVADTDTATSSTAEILSLNFDGSLRWNFTTVNGFGTVVLGRDNHVYIKIQSGFHGNEATYKLAQ